jgi:hypothetical protein
MRHQSRTLGYLNWGTEKVDEIEVAVVQLEKVVMTLPHVASAKMEAEAAVIKDDINNSYPSFEVDWAELELAYQDFTAAVRDFAYIMRQILTSSTEAELENRLPFLQAVLMSVSDTIDFAHKEIDTITHLTIKGDLERAISTCNLSWGGSPRGLQEGPVVKGSAKSPT